MLKEKSRDRPPRRKPATSLFAGRAFAADPSRFAGAIAEIVEPAPTNGAMRLDLYAIDAGRVERERTLDADTIRVLAHGERSSVAAGGSPDADSLEDLDAFFVAFRDAGVDSERIPGTKLGYCAAGLFGFDLLDHIHGGTSLAGSPRF